MHKKQNENLKRIYIQEEIGSMICSSRIVSKIGSTRRLSGYIMLSSATSKFTE